jgi:DNA polymerase elongation subunit (family B)
LRKECKNKAKQYKEIGDLENSKYWDEESSSLKILSNGSFGKFGNKYSILYSPQLVTQTTVSGQLFLLMLIEDFELNKFSVISANTDGIVINVPTNRDGEFKRISNLWEKSLGFELEETIFKSLHQRDINNFIGIKMNNEN